MRPRPPTGRSAPTDPDRADEAADGLDRVILAAERRRDEAVLAEAVAALRAVAPDRPLGRHALSLVQATDGAVDAAGFSAALGAATEAGEVDSLLARQATALADIGACAQAVPLFQAGIRRAGRLGSVAASDGLAGCYARLGAALLPSVPDSAEVLFRDAAALDSASTNGRTALIGLGDARYAAGRPRRGGARLPGGHLRRCAGRFDRRGGGQETQRAGHGGRAGLAFDRGAMTPRSICSLLLLTLAAACHPPSEQAQYGAGPGAREALGLDLPGRLDLEPRGQQVPRRQLPRRLG